MRYKLAIFDMDGTILNTLEDLTDSTNYALRANGMPERSIEEVRGFVGNGIRKLIERAVGVGSDKETTDKVFDCFKEYYRTHCAIKTRPYDGIIDTINALKNMGVMTAVVSNKADFAVQSLCEDYFEGLFDYAVGDKEGQRRKPYPDAVYEVLDRLKVDKADAVYIGDSEVDYMTAQNSGLDVIMVGWGFRDEEFLIAKGAPFVIYDTEDILRLILGERQAVNPFLPEDVYIPDGEPHVFGDRVYLYGSHDKEGGHTFCMLDYVVYSAAVDDLTKWTTKGVSYSASQDPAYPRRKYMYAPDVVRGNDGRYYLYYCMAGEYGVGGYTEPISVAVCDTPDGSFSFLGHVRNKDGSLMKKYVCFDPAVLNDDGVIRLYYGTQYAYEEQESFFDTEEGILREMEMFGRSREEILSYEDSIMGPIGAVLEDDMLTIKEEPKHIIPYRTKGTDFAEHPFFEAASMRRVGDKYYFIYSSWKNHELCYAVSDYPDRDFRFGGTIVSNADIGYQGREACDMLNMTGTTHGSIELINGSWYVFYHRLTHKSDYSRQACAEKIIINEDGSINQVEMTSCGLNRAPLRAEGTYPAFIACNITNGHMPHGCNSIYKEEFPNVTNKENERFIAEIEEGTLIGFKYFTFEKVRKIGVIARVETEENKVGYEGPLRKDERNEEAYFGQHTIKCPGKASDVPLIELRLSECGEAIGFIAIDEECDTWKKYMVDVDVETGTYPVYLIYHGKSKLQLKELVYE